MSRDVFINEFSKRAPAPPVLNDDEPVHEWFGLSYASYAVQPRTLLQSMPAEWQCRFVACMEELHDAFAHVDQAPGYHVQPCEWTEPGDVDERAYAYLGITRDEDGTYWDRDGNELDPRLTCVPVPTGDPVPHYSRGRTRVEPRPPATEDTCRPVEVERLAAGMGPEAADG